MSENLSLLYLCILLVAVLYASVGHGGASGYLALMSLFSMPMAEIKPVALILNIIVSFIAFVQFYRSGYFDAKIFLTLAATSIPAAFLGGTISLDPTLYKQILGALLLFTAIRLMIPMDKDNHQSKPMNTYILLLIGMLIGFISGLIGIGGGIILSPLLILMHYSNVKITSGISALFIFVNSIAGILGQFKQGIQVSTSMSMMIMVAVVGGLIGSYIGAKHFQMNVLKKVLAIVLMVASVKLMFL